MRIYFGLYFVLLILKFYWYVRLRVYGKFVLTKTTFSSRARHLLPSRSPAEGHTAAGPWPLAAMATTPAPLQLCRGAALVTAGFVAMVAGSADRPTLARPRAELTISDVDDGMTADWVDFPHAFLAEVSNAISFWRMFWHFHCQKSLEIVWIMFCCINILPEDKRKTKNSNKAIFGPPPVLRVKFDPRVLHCASKITTNEKRLGIDFTVKRK